MHQEKHEGMTYSIIVWPEENKAGAAYLVRGVKTLSSCLILLCIVHPGH